MLNNGIKYWRQKLNKTQQDLANFLGIPRSLFSIIESGRAIPSLEELEKIAEFLEVTPGHIYTKEQLNVLFELEKAEKEKATKK